MWKRKVSSVSATKCGYDFWGIELHHLEVRIRGLGSCTAAYFATLSMASFSGMLMSISIQGCLWGWPRGEGVKDELRTRSYTHHRGYSNAFFSLFLLFLLLFLLLPRYALRIPTLVPIFQRLSTVLIAYEGDSTSNNQRYPASIRSLRSCIH